MPKYVRRRTLYEAFQLPAAKDFNLEPFHRWVNRHKFEYTSERDCSLSFVSQGVTMVADPNDWIVKHPDGYFYVCSPDDFVKDYKRRYTKQRTRNTSKEKK